MQKFAEKVALITGGTSGIGQTTAIAFAKLGAKVVVAGRSEDDTESRPKVGEIPIQSLPYPGKQADMIAQPDSDLSNYRPADKLKDKVAIITGGDSGIGRAVAIAFAMEGADIAIIYNQSDDDARTTREMVETHQRQCLVIKSDVRSKQQCQEAISQTLERFGKLNILVNNAAFQQSHESFEEVSEEEIRRTFETNIFGYMFMAQAALPHLTEGDVIINTGSTTAILGHPTLIPYSATKGAIHVFTKSLAVNLAERKIRVNAVVPGPVWTPAIPASSPPEALKSWGNIAALGRSGQPEELAPAYVFLASSDGSFVTDSLLEVSGGLISVE